MNTTRRDFLKLVGAMGAGTVIGYYTVDLRRIFAQTSNSDTHVLWLQGASDSGCTISLLQGANPDLVDVMTRFRLAVEFQPTLMIPTGEDALMALSNVAKGVAPLDLLIVEGAVPEGNFCTVGEIDGTPVPFEQWVKTLGERASYVVAVGTCASYGGIPAATPNPTRCRSVSQVLPSRQVINVPGCPSHPDWITLTLANVLQGIQPQLDDYGRPMAFFDEEVHEKCPLHDYYEEEIFASFPSGKGCLYELGCRGKETHADCPTRLWNNGTSFCMAGLWRGGTEVYASGAPCIGCTEPGFPDAPFSPFYREGDDERDEREEDEERTTTRSSTTSSRSTNTTTSRATTTRPSTTTTSTTTRPTSSRTTSAAKGSSTRTHEDDDEQRQTSSRTTYTTRRTTSTTKTGDDDEEEAFPTISALWRLIRRMFQ